MSFPPSFRQTAQKSLSPARRTASLLLSSGEKTQYGSKKTTSGSER